MCRPWGWGGPFACCLTKISKGLTSSLFVVSSSGNETNETGIGGHRGKKMLREHETGSKRIEAYLVETFHNGGSVEPGKNSPRKKRAICTTLKGA